MRFGQLKDEDSEALTKTLSELVSLEVEMQAYVQSRGGPGGLTESEVVGLEDKIKKWLEKAREVARKFGPREFTLTAEIGLPPRVSASFTWDA